MWQTRGREKWLLEGDANMAYYHGIANGRKCKCLIRSLEDNGTLISAMDQLQEHITSFYKNLFGSETQSKLRLHPSLWKESSKVSMEENEELTKPFSMEELEVVVRGLKEGAAPGPDGFNATFFKIFWEDTKGLLLELL